MTDLNASRALFFFFFLPPFWWSETIQIKHWLSWLRVYKLIIRIISLNESTIESKKVVFLVFGFVCFFFFSVFCFLVCEWVSGWQLYGWAEGFRGWGWPATHFPGRPIGKHPFIYTLQSNLIKYFCRSERPDARGSSLAAIVLVSAVGQSIHGRILGRQLACESRPRLASLVSIAGINGCYSHRQERLRNSISES